MLHYSPNVNWPSDLRTETKLQRFVKKYALFGDH